MSRPLDTIIELQRDLDELNAAKAQLAGVPDWMRELHEEHSAGAAEIQGLRDILEEIGRERRTAEGEIGDLRERVKHFQEQIALVRNQREYSALLQEIDTAKAKIRELEETVLTHMERHEEAQRDLEQAEASFSELDARHAAELERWETEKPTVARRVDELEQRIEVLQERLPKPVLLRFKRVLTHYEGRALAPVLQVERGGKGPQIWHCGACNYRVRPQAVVAIQTRGSLESCDSCKRILFLEEGAD